MEGDQLKTFKRPNPDNYLTVSVKKAGEFNLNNKPNLYYVQIVEPISEVNKTLGINTNQQQQLTIKQRWQTCLLYTSPSPRDATLSRMPSSA